MRISEPEKELTVELFPDLIKEPIDINIFLNPGEVDIERRGLDCDSCPTMDEVSPEKSSFILARVGRPMKIYALGLTIDEIINYYEAEKAQEPTQTMVAIQRLKELSSA
jgi:hypothetical protein